MKKQRGFKSISDLFADRVQAESKGYVSREFQDFGYRLANELNDLKHKSLYIKMSKEVDRTLLEQARRFVIDADSARSKARLFMWKVKQLQTKAKEKNDKMKPEQTSLF